MSVAAASPNPFHQNTNGPAELKVGQALHLPKLTHNRNHDDTNQPANQLTQRALSRSGSWGSNHVNERYRYADSSLSFNK